MFQFVDENDRGTFGRFSLQPGGEQPGGTDAEATQRYAVFIMQRDGASAEGDRVGVQESLDRFPDGYAELAGGLGDDGERLFQLIFGLVSKSGAGVARGSCQRGPPDPAGADSIR